MPCRAGQTFGATVLLLLLRTVSTLHSAFAFTELRKTHFELRMFDTRTHSSESDSEGPSPKLRANFRATHCTVRAQRICIHGRRTFELHSAEGPSAAQRLRSDFRATHCEYNYYMYYLVVRSAYRIHGTSYVWHSVQTQCRGPQAESETSSGQIWVYIFMSLCSLNCFYGSSMKFRTLSWCDWSPCQHRKEFQSNIALPFCQSGQTFVGEDGPWKNGLPLAIGLRREFK